MTLEERIEAAARAICRRVALDPDADCNGVIIDFADDRPLWWQQVADHISAAFPELFAGTHKIVPVEPSDEMLNAADACGYSGPSAIYRAMIEAAP